MTLDMVKDLISSSIGIQSATLHGFGEPLLHPHFIEILRLLADKNIRVRFTTNATLITQKIAALLVECCVDTITVSLDASSPDVLSLLRGGTDLEKVLSNMRTIQNEKKAAGSLYPKLCINMVVNQMNYTEAEAVIGLAASIDAKAIMLQPFVAPHSQISHLCWEPEQSPGWLEAVQSCAIEHGIGLNSPWQSSKTKIAGKISCSRIMTSIYVASDGGIYPCCYVPHVKDYKMGCLSKLSIEEIWNGHLYRDLRTSFFQNCDLKKICSHCSENNMSIIN